MHNNSNDRLIAVLEPVRELLHEVEQLRRIARKHPHLREQVLAARLNVDREIENLRGVSEELR